ncbi:hypothetical protein C1645_837138 [Glomus cerebriforme]|uniref:Protein kinase domain-containing protein n=1 Tax=Glomus cerebriforme TaxID=658196 RepID=A0A397S9D3_9GLOM|nr:hypothetical protein C1645_837138 [Glomus cerebriforme]
MSTIFEVIDSLLLSKEETNKLQTYLIKHNQERETLYSALMSPLKTDEDKLELLKEFLKTLSADEDKLELLKEFLKNLSADEDKLELLKEFLKTLSADEHPGKKIKLEDSHDNTPKFLNNLLRPFDESIDCDNIMQHLSEPLLRKLPSLFADLLPDVLESDVSSMVNTRELCSVVNNIMNLIFKGRPGGEGFTSDCINKHILDIIILAQRFVLGCSNIEIDRNRAIHSDSNTSGKKKQLDRPDVTIYYNRVLVMFGEEKALEGDIGIAEGDLDNYFSYWNPLAFGRLPLVMAFVAAGERLQFYYYYYDKSSNKPKRVEIGDILLIGGDNRSFNYMALQRTINFIRILQTWNRDKILDIPKLKLFEVKIRANDGAVAIFPQKIHKRVKIKSSKEAEFYKGFYDNVFPKLGGQYKQIKFSLTRTSMHLELAPVGYTTFPTTENELRAAILDVLKTVKILHINGVVHRDIRWENIVRLMDNNWMLIDFEEAALIGDIRPTLNIAAPEHRNEDTCKKAGDIWLIGNLIDDQRIHIYLSESAKNFRDRLMFQDPNERPTATDAIEDDWFNDM